MVWPITGAESYVRETRYVNVTARSWEHLNTIVVANRLSNNVSSVKYFWGALVRALRRARHFALVEGFVDATAVAANHDSHNSAPRPAENDLRATIAESAPHPGDPFLLAYPPNSKNKHL